MPPVINVEGLSKSFGKYAILENLSLSVREGEGYGLVGLNGAGKTTLLRLLLGLLKADSGGLSVLGTDPWAHNAASYRRIGVVLEHDGFSGNLTALQNLKIFAAAKGVAWSDALRYFDEFWGWTAICNNRRPVKYFSRGQRVQCALCRAFLGWPALYLLDEPIVALDVDAYDHFVALVRAARERGGTFIISSHQLNAIDDLCDRVGILRDRTLTELHSTGRRGGSAPEWELDADPDARWASIIGETCGVTAVRQNGCWRFAVQSPNDTIPLLVERLVKEGCAVRRVGPVVDGFSAAIRSQYQKKGQPGISAKEKQTP